MSRRWATALSCSLGLACASGTGARGNSTEDTEGTLGPGGETNDTIDPTAFSTTAAADSSTGTDSASASATDATAEPTSSSATGTTVAGDGPVVVDIAPADGSEGVAAGTSIQLTFSAAMDPRTLVADDGSCSGAVQLSHDDFATCDALDGTVVASDGDTTFSFTPAAALTSATNHRVRVTTAAQSADAAPLASEYTSDGFVARYWHTIAIDGIDDWNGDESFASSTAGHTDYVAWDEQYVYLGVRSPDVAGGNGSVWVVVYFGGANGSSDGVLYNTQQPTLPFEARWHLRWRADNLYTDAVEFDGDAWAGTAWEIGPGDVYANGELLELRVARSTLGDPTQLELHLGLLREQNLDEASWAACPASSYADGYDPDYTAWWSFDLTGSVVPGSHLPLP